MTISLNNSDPTGFFMFLHYLDVTLIMKPYFASCGKSGGNSASNMDSGTTRIAADAFG